MVVYFTSIQKELFLLGGMFIQFAPHMFFIFMYVVFMVYQIISVGEIRMSFLDVEYLSSLVSFCTNFLTNYGCGFRAS